MTRYRHLLQQVRNLGRYPTDEEAERVLTAVLALLGSQLTGDERCALAAVPSRLAQASCRECDRTAPADGSPVLTATSGTGRSASVSAHPGCPPPMRRSSL
ncbi:DUF2267 domain-containing protein [Kitasatospora griseola]|uniref:DUF2267 domain-containing protein n=1 Tax=Kitasatospora griseola TaxID=2064 RepID=UPI003855A065